MMIAVAIFQVDRTLSGGPPVTNDSNQYEQPCDRISEVPERQKQMAVSERELQLRHYKNRSFRKRRD